MEDREAVGHGRSAYVAGHCRCEECTEANAAYQRNRWRLLNRPDAEPQVAIIDAVATRRRLNRLLERGATLTSIARGSQVPRSTLADIAEGRTRRTRRSVHDAVVNAYRSHVARGRRTSLSGASTSVAGGVVQGVLDSDVVADRD